MRQSYFTVRTLVRAQTVVFKSSHNHTLSIIEVIWKCGEETSIGFMASTTSIIRCNVDWSSKVLVNDICKLMNVAVSIKMGRSTY